MKLFLASLNRILLPACIAIFIAAAWTHGSGVAPYEGLVASRARAADTVDTTNKQVMGRYGLISTEALTSVRLALGNWSQSASVTDTCAGSTSTETASIEYPAGTFTQIKLLGSTSFTIPDGNLVFTDYATVSIPANTTFWVRRFIQSANGVCYFSHQNSFFNEATNAAPSGLSDQTMGGTITNSLAVGVPPLAVLAMTIHPSAIIEGDSIGIGVNDPEDNSSTITGWNGKTGFITRSIGSVPFLNLSWPSKIAEFYTARAPARQQLLTKGSELITQLGVNDLDVNNRTPAQVIGDLQTIWAFTHTGEKVFQTTITPHSSSTDSWVTSINQTAINPSTHATLNSDFRTGVAGLTGFYDVASVYETSQGSDIWVSVCSTACTPDGLHPNHTGYLLVPPSGVIQTPTYPFLLKRDIDPASNDNDPMWLEKVA